MMRAGFGRFTRFLPSIAVVCALGVSTFARAGDASRQPKEQDPEWRRWHPAPPAPLDLQRLPPRPELPNTPVAVAAVPAAARRSAAENALRRGLDFYYGIATKAEYPVYGRCAGWCGSYDIDLKFRSGEDSQQLPSDAVKMQSVGTPQVTEAYLAAFLALGDPAILSRAKEGANLMLAGQSPYGGWFFEMWVGPGRARGSHVWPGRAAWPDAGPEHGTDTATIDDGNTFGPAEALYKVWWVTKEQRYYEGWRRAMEFLLLAQQAYGGGFPQAFPSDGYHRYATFNDDATLNAVEALLRAYRRTGERRYFDAVVTCADWILRVNRPGQGWGAQYDASGAVASARRFEPAGLEPPGTSSAMQILATVYEWTGDPRYLEPLADAAAWLQRVQLKPGVWARFYHPDTNEPWYRTGDGKDCDFAEAKGGYTWQGAWGRRGLELAERYRTAGRKPPLPRIAPPGDPAFEAAVPARTPPQPVEVAEIIARQSDNGCWVGGGRSGRQRNDTSGKFFGSTMFVNNVHRLAAAVAAERNR